MRPLLLAFASGDADRPAVGAAATALGGVLGLRVEQRVLPEGGAAAVLEVAAQARAQVVAVPNAAGHAARLVTELVPRCERPVLVVPVGRRVVPRDSLERVLVPLDGTVAAAEPVAAIVGMFCACGTDVVVLHVFDPATVPPFWDHPEHARESWAEEFLARYCDQPSARLELRSGTPGESVVEVAVSEHADLIALGWSRTRASGRARTVRATLARSTVPVLLVPRPGTTPERDG